jgi:hypothetical protein
MKNLSFISIITLASVLLATGPALSQAPENMVLGGTRCLLHR